jgi:UDP-glucose 4-epimerase
MFGLDFVIFRPHNVYGEYQNIGDRYRNVVGIFMNQIIQGKPMTVFGDGEQQRAFSYITDISAIIARSPTVRDARNRIFNIGDDTPYTVNELARRVAEAMGTEPRTTHLPSRNEVSVAFCDHSHCREVFSSNSGTPLEDGLRKMTAWVKNVGCRKSKTYKRIEVRRRLPQAWVDEI